MKTPKNDPKIISNKLPAPRWHKLVIALKILGWIWFIILGTAAITLFGSGYLISAVANWLSALFATHLSWAVLARRGIDVTRSVKVSAIIAFAIVGMIFAPKNSVQPKTPLEVAAIPADKPTPTLAEPSTADTLKAMTAKIDDFALQPLDRKWDPEGYAKLGKRVWDLSNEYRRWAGLAAMQNAACKEVSAIAIWEEATRAQLAWHVVCGEERFVISEAMARSVRAHLDPNAPYSDRKKYGAPVPAAQPMSAAFANFDPRIAVANCETTLKGAAVDQGSFSTSGVPKFRKDDEAGQMILTGDFSAGNAYGGTVSAKYSCVVSAFDGTVVALSTRDALGVHSIK
jgi:hypothetical protein